MTSNPNETKLWSHPTVEKTQLASFVLYVNQKRGLTLSTFEDLHRWSVTEINEFAQDVWQFCDIKCSDPTEHVSTGIDKMWPPPTWFPGAKLNYAENLLAHGLAHKPDSVAVTAYSEMTESPIHLTFKQLEGEVSRWITCLKGLGVQAGDRVGVVLPNGIDALVILLACAACGVVFSSTAPDMGAEGIIERYRQLEPKVFICQAMVVYSGNSLNLKDKIVRVHDELKQHVHGFHATVIVKGWVPDNPDILSVATLLSSKRQPVHYKQLPFDHPLYVLYSSGTTGPPKCICHSAGRVLLQHKKEHILHCDFRPDSVYYQYTTTGWMMWNYLVSALACGSRIVLFDGNPTHPSPSSQLDLLRKEGVTNWGTSPKFLDFLKATDLSPDSVNLPALRMVHTSGAPLSPELSRWFYRTFHPHVGLFNGSGGTDLVGGLLMPSPISSVYPGEIAGPALGIKVEVWDEAGNDMTASGEPGELVITRPFFTMPLTFLGKAGSDGYYNAYFSKFPGVWCHGDFIRWNPKTGGYYVLGRSDGVLNPGGVRFGSAEIYSIVERFPEVLDSIAVGQKLPNSRDEQVLLFVTLRQGSSWKNKLRDAIAAAIRASLSPRHVPAHIIRVSDLPYTTNGKKIEKLVRDVVSGLSVRPSAAVSNPESLREFEQYERLRHTKANI